MRKIFFIDVAAAAAAAAAAAHFRGCSRSPFAYAAFGALDVPAAAP
jgi:hypothetical protein